jgi:hypothetical protein
VELIQKELEPKETESDDSGTVMNSTFRLETLTSEAETKMKDRFRKQYRDFIVKQEGNEEEKK